MGYKEISEVMSKILEQMEKRGLSKDYQIGSLTGLVINLLSDVPDKEAKRILETYKKVLK